MNDKRPRTAPDLVHGYAAIGEHMGITSKAAEQRAAKGQIPTFRLSGPAVIARKSALDRAPPVKRGRRPCDNPEERKAANEARRAEQRDELGTLELLRKERARAELGAAGLLYGMQAIAGYIGLTVPQAKHLHYAGRLPTFMMGRKICSTRAALETQFQNLQEAANGQRS